MAGRRGENGGGGKPPPPLRPFGPALPPSAGAAAPATPPPGSRGAKKAASRLDIVYEDDFCIVVNKPAGLAVQGGKGVGASLDAILAALRADRPLLVHRLDRDTSGLVLAAKGRRAAADFSALFRAGASGGAVKSYTAVCAGIPERRAGTIRLDIEARGSAKMAETRYRVAEEFGCGQAAHFGMAGGFALLELELGTGRMHQIRRHLAMIGCPVLGDDKYGDFALNRALRKSAGLRGLLLHASRLEVPRAPGGSRLDVRAPLPERFARFLEAARVGG